MLITLWAGQTSGKQYTITDAVPGRFQSSASQQPDFHTRKPRRFCATVHRSPGIENLVCGLGVRGVGAGYGLYQEVRAGNEEKPASGSVAAGPVVFLGATGNTVSVLFAGQAGRS